MACEKNTISSNIAELKLAVEECPGQVAENADWVVQEVNSYASFGGSISTVSRSPISQSRQNQRGTITDLDATFSYNMDLTANNLKFLAPGFFYDAGVQAETITAPAGDVSVSVVAGVITLSSAAGFSEIPNPGTWISISGLGEENTGFAQVSSADEDSIVLGAATFPGAATAGTGLEAVISLPETYRNQKDPAKIVQTTYQAERVLGKGDFAGTQAQYVTGGFANELTVNIPQADKVSVDLGFVGMQQEFRTGNTGDLPKSEAGTIVPALGEPAINTSQNVKLAKLYVKNSAANLFAYLTDSLTISLNNNVTIDKAIGVLGGIGASEGQFDVSASLTAYFKSVAAMQAIVDNADCALFVVLQDPDGKGIIIDVAGAQLGGGELNVEQNTSLTIPLEITGYEGENGYTMQISFFG